ncbi:unnamed protein product [Closterium sp. NIES-54]
MRGYYGSATRFISHSSCALPGANHPAPVSHPPFPPPPQEGLMIVSMVTCALLLGSILKVGKTFVSEREEQEFMAACLRFCALYQRGDRPPHPRKSFETFWASR